MTDDEREYLTKLKQVEPFTGIRIPILGTQEMAKIQFIGRGEVAFYQEGNRALLAVVLVGPGIIDDDSIRRWDSGRRIGEDERDAIVDRITLALHAIGVTDVRVPPRPGLFALMKKLTRDANVIHVPIAGIEPGARIKFAVKGDLAFYQQGDRTLLVPVDPQTGEIYTKAMKRWDNGYKVSDEERTAILIHIADAWRQTR